MMSVSPGMSAGHAGGYFSKEVPEKEIDRAHEEYGRPSHNVLNVAVTRARFGTRIFTNSIAGLTRSVETVDEKTSTLTRTERDPSRGALQRNNARPIRGLRQ